MRYLGVWPDKKLQWTAHVQLISQKASLRISKLEKVCRMFWDIARHTMRVFYVSALLPVLDFAALSWSNITTGRLRSHKIQRSALLLVTGAMKTTPTNSLEIEGQVLPFHLHFKECVLKKLLRVHKYRNFNVAHRWVQLYKETSVRGPYSSPIQQALRWYHGVTFPSLDILESCSVPSAPCDLETLSKSIAIKPPLEATKIAQEADPQHMGIFHRRFEKRDIYGVRSGGIRL